MRLEDIHVGDKLRIRDWDDMVSEFGLNEDGNILCKFTFVTTMKSLCGTEFKVSCVSGNGIRPDIEDVVPGGMSTETSLFSWMISADMVEPAAPSPLDVPDPEGLFSFLL